MRATINNESTTTEPPALKWTEAKATGGLKCILLVPNLHPDSAVVEAQKMLSLY